MAGQEQIQSISDQVKKQLRELPTVASEFPQPYLDRLPAYAQELRLWNDSLHILDLNYQTASDEEKNFIALHETFEAAKTRMKSGNMQKRSIIPFIREKINKIHVNEIERLHEPVHPLLEIALEAWKNRPLHAHKVSEHDVEHQLHGMLRLALLETQHHIEHTKDKGKASQIILQTQQAIIDTALDLSIRAKSTGNDSFARETEGMLTLAFNLTAESDEIILLHQGKLNKKQVATFAERVLYDPIIYSTNSELDPKRPVSNENPKYILDHTDQIDFVSAFKRSVTGNTGDPSKTIRQYIHEQVIKLPQQILFSGIAAEQALEMLPAYINTRVEANAQYSIYEFAHNMSTGRATTVSEHQLQKSIAEMLEDVDDDWMRETPISDDLFQRAVAEQLTFAIDKKATLVDAMANMVKRKLPIEAPPNDGWITKDIPLDQSDNLTHAGKIAEELFDHMAGAEFVGSLHVTAKQLKDQLGPRLKAFKDFFTMSHRRGQYLKTLLAFNPKGARLHVSPYKNQLMSILVDGGKRAPHGLSASHSQAVSGSIAAHWNADVQPVAGMSIFSLAYSKDAVNQMKQVISALELRNSRHALTEIVPKEMLQVPSIAVVPEHMDQTELSALNKVYASYIIEQIEREQKMWTESGSNISADMWEFQRFMLNLLAAEEPFELNGVNYVPNTELHNLIAAKVIKLTLDNIQVALSHDNKSSQPHFDACMEMLQITIPFMPIATRKHFVQRYALEALNFAGDFVTDGKWKKFCYTIGFWNPALLPGLKGTHINIADVQEGIPLIQDTELAQTLVDETIKLASGWKHINGITSMQLLAELESMHARSHKVEDAVTHLKTSALAQFIDVVRNFSADEKKKKEKEKEKEKEIVIVEDTSKENYKKLNRTVKEAVILTIMRRFKADIPRDPEVINTYIKKLEKQAEDIRRSIKEGDVTSVDEAFDKIRKSVATFQEKLTEFVPDIAPLNETKAIMDAMIANRSTALVASSPLTARDLEAAAKVSGEEVARNIALSMAKQIEDGMGGAMMTTEVKNALRFVFTTFGANVTLSVHEVVSILSKISALSTLHKSIAELRSVADDQTAHLARYIGGVDVQGYTENPALRALAFYNRTAPLLGYDRIEEAELMMQAWTESQQNLYPEIKPEKKLRRSDKTN